MKLGLGTVQFGRDYGISNSRGICSLDTIRAILSMAHSEGVKLLDTAADYGISEENIGICSNEQEIFKVVTKVSKLRTNLAPKADIARIEKSLRRSLARQGQNSVYGLLIHSANDLFGSNGNEVWDELLRLCSFGLATKIGVSVYNAEELDSVLAQFPIDLVQLPLNVFDQRLIKSGHIRELVSRGIEIHARSIFLQGALLMPPENLPNNLAYHSPIFEIYHQALRKVGLSPIQGAVSFIMEQADVAYALVGVTTPAELSRIIDATRVDYLPSIEFGEFSLNDASLLDPTRWNLGL